MTYSLLEVLRDRYAFDGTPRFEDLGVFHVPFESMGEGPSVESRLRDGALRGERIALIADSGCGKSSVISHVLGPTAEGVFPVLVPVHSLREGATSAEQVADMVLTQFARQARTAAIAHQDAARASGARREVTESTGRARHIGVQAPGGALKADIATEITRQVTTVQPVSLPEKIEIIVQCLQPVYRDSLMPVVIFDDTDRWSTPAENRIVDGFFGQAIRWLTDLHVSLVVATHSHYIESRAGGATLLTFLDTKVALPRLPSADQLARILAGFNRSSQHRVVVASVGVRRGLLLGSSIRGSCVAGC